MWTCKHSFGEGEVLMNSVSYWAYGRVLSYVSEWCKCEWANLNTFHLWHYDHDRGTTLGYRKHNMRKCLSIFLRLRSWFGLIGTRLCSGTCLTLSSVLGFMHVLYSGHASSTIISVSNNKSLVDKEENPRRISDGDWIRLIKVASMQYH